MTDLINRADAIRKYQEVCNGIKCGECPLLIKVNTEKGSHLITDCKLEAFLHNLPSASVEVVRCRDCRWYDNRYGDVCHNPRYGDGWANYPPPYVNEDYWCKDGDGRKGGDPE